MVSINHTSYYYHYQPIYYQDHYAKLSGSWGTFTSAYVPDKLIYPSQQEVPDFFIPQVSLLGNIGPLGSYLTHFKNSKLSMIRREKDCNYYVFKKFICKPWHFL